MIHGLRDLREERGAREVVVHLLGDSISVDVAVELDLLRQRRRDRVRLRRLVVGRRSGPPDVFGHLVDRGAGVVLVLHAHVLPVEHSRDVGEEEQHGDDDDRRQGDRHDQLDQVNPLRRESSPARHRWPAVGPTTKQDSACFSIACIALASAAGSHGWWPPSVLVSSTSVLVAPVTVTVPV